MPEGFHADADRVSDGDGGRAAVGDDHHAVHAEQRTAAVGFGEAVAEDDVELGLEQVVALDVAEVLQRDRKFYTSETVVMQWDVLAGKIFGQGVRSRLSIGRKGRFTGSAGGGKVISI